MDSELVNASERLHTSTNLLFSKGVSGSLALLEVTVQRLCRLEMEQSHWALSLHSSWQLLHITLNSVFCPTIDHTLHTHAFPSLSLYPLLHVCHCCMFYSKAECYGNLVWGINRNSDTFKKNRVWVKQNKVCIKHTRQMKQAAVVSLWKIDMLVEMNTVPISLQK